MQIILLENLSNLGKLGQVVSVKNGYARNFLLPKKKAIRATEENIKLFEERRAIIEKEDAEKKALSEKICEKINGMQVVIIRQAGEDGRLYGSVAARDIANAISQKFKEEVPSSAVVLNIKFKEIGIYNVDIMLHADVKASIQLNIARSEEEANKAVGTDKNEEPKVEKAKKGIRVTKGKDKTEKNTKVSGRAKKKSVDEKKSTLEKETKKVKEPKETKEDSK